MRRWMVALGSLVGIAGIALAVVGRWGMHMGNDPQLRAIALFSGSGDLGVLQLIVTAMFYSGIALVVIGALVVWRGTAAPRDRPASGFLKALTIAVGLIVALPALWLASRAAGSSRASTPAGANDGDDNCTPALVLAGTPDGGVRLRAKPGVVDDASPVIPKCTEVCAAPDRSGWRWVRASPRDVGYIATLELVPAGDQRCAH